MNPHHQAFVHFSASFSAWVRTLSFPEVPVRGLLIVYPFFFARQSNRAERRRHMRSADGADVQLKIANSKSRF